MAEYKSTAQMTPKQIEWWRRSRWKARTDLGWLCRNVLGYKHVSDNNVQPGDSIVEGPHLPIHQPLIDTVQKFLVPTPQQALEHDKLVNGQWDYKPLIPIPLLPGKKRTLILDFRGSLKTTINTMAHTIQWIINYPDVAIMVVQSNGAKAEAFIGEIKAHFIGNGKFRALFPEHCPQGNRVNDFGTRVQFTTCARSASVIRKEPTVMASSIDKGMAGYHCDLIKCSDIVDPSNINGQGLQDVKRSFNYLKPLLVSPSWGRIDVEGTRYHTDDAYGAIIEEELNTPPDEREYQMYIRSCYQRITPDGKPEKFDIAGLKLPFKLDENGKPISWWPERFKAADYEKMKRADPFVFATQQLNDPSAAGEFKPFPVMPGKYPVYITRQNFQQRIVVSHREIIVDTAATNNKRSDYTVLTVVAWDKGFGRAYVERIIRGRFTTDQIINHIVALMLEFKPLKLKIEKNLHTLGMESSLKRALQRTAALENVHVKLDLIPRDNQTAKEERIQTALQPWYMSGDIRFLDDLDRWCPGVTKALETELEDFPSAKNDDILDTLADIFQNKKYFGRENRRATAEDILHMHKAAFAKLADQELHRWGVGGAEESTGDGYFL